MNREERIERLRYGTEGGSGMKIVTQSRRPKDPRIGRWECMCGCVFEIETGEDAAPFRHDFDRKDREDFVWGPCPCCGQGTIGHGRPHGEQRGRSVRWDRAMPRPPVAS